ncbi:hypothetical protein [Paraclostridium bifermentans]|uniref:hypothetical protein n=1 Tax=Paraclostridium bifermentans TaxID=1490 RepID=UPI00374EB407
MLNILDYAVIGVPLLTFIKEFYRLATSGFVYEPYEQRIGSVIDLSLMILFVMFGMKMFNSSEDIIYALYKFMKILLYSSLILNISNVMSKCDYAQYINPEKRKFKGYVKAVKSRRIIMLIANIAYCVIYRPTTSIVTLIVLLLLKLYISHSCYLIKQGLGLSSKLKDC